MSMQITAGDDRDDESDDRLDRSAVRDDDDDRANDRTSRRSSQDRDAGDEGADVDEDDEEPEDGWAAEARRLRAALKKANSTGQRRRQQLKDLQAAKRNAADEEPEDDEDEKPSKETLDAKSLQKMLKKAREDAKAEAAEEHKKDLLIMRAESKLTSAGVSERSVRLLRNEIDLDDFADDPEEEIDRLKVEFPEFFRRTRSSARRINGGDEREGGKRGPMTTSERQAAQIRMGSRS